MALACGITGCAPGSPKGSDALASDSLAAIINDARTNTLAAQSVHITGWVVSSGRKTPSP